MTLIHYDSVQWTCNRAPHFPDLVPVSTFLKDHRLLPAIRKVCIYFYFFIIFAGLFILDSQTCREVQELLSSPTTQTGNALDQLELTDIKGWRLNGDTKLRERAGGKWAENKTGGKNTHEILFESPKIN